MLIPSVVYPLLCAFGKGTASVVDDPCERIEVNPKWLTVKHLLGVIAANDPGGRRGRTLVCVGDGKAASQVAQYLRHGAAKVLRDQLIRYEKFKGGSVPLVAAAAAAAAVAGGPTSEMGRAAKRRRRKRQDESDAASGTTPLDAAAAALAAVHDDAAAADAAARLVGAPDEELLVCFAEIDGEAVVVCALRSDGGARDSSSLEGMLRDVQPRHVILVDPELVAMRQLEVYSYATPGPPLNVYVCSFHNSIQEQQVRRCPLQKPPCDTHTHTDTHTQTHRHTHTHTHTHSLTYARARDSSLTSTSF
jgi:hypothetical protein